MYSSGANEEVVGKAIKEFNIPREKVTILAKVFGTVPEERGIFNFFFEDQMAKSKDYINRGGKYFHAMDRRKCESLATDTEQVSPAAQS